MKITVACIKSLTEMQANRKLDTEFDFFVNFTKMNHHESVRIAAFKAIILLFCPSNNALSIVIKLLENRKESPRLKYKVISFLLIFT